VDLEFRLPTNSGTSLTEEKERVRSAAVEPAELPPLEAGLDLDPDSARLDLDPGSG